MPYVIDWLAPYEPLDLLAGLGGLQLMPENADRLLRLEMLSPVVAVSVSDATDKKPIMSPRRWRDLVNGPLITNTAIPRLEDVQTAEFADEVTFFDGSYLVLPGTNADATFMVRQLLRALLLRPIPFPDADVAEFANAAAGLLLVLSDRAARRAGLVRGHAVVHTEEGSVIVPEAARFSMLKAAVTFDQSEIDRMLLWSRLSSVALDRLLLTATDDAQLEDPDRNPVLDAPLIRVGGQVVVLAPDLLLTALCRSIASFAIERGSIQYLADAFRGAVATSVLESLEQLNLPVLPLQTADTSGRPFSSAWFGLDRDKLLLSVVVTDPMDEGLPLPADWHPDALGGEIAEHIVQSVTQAGNLATPPVEILCLVAMQTLGRPMGVEIPLARLPNVVELLSMTAGELEIVSLLERGNLLALRQYAHAKRTFRAKTSAISPLELDEFAFYRSHHHSYYASDGPRPTAVSFMPGPSEKLRNEVRNRYDFHGVVGPGARGAFEVVLLHGDISVPIYAPRDRRNLVALLVDNQPLPIWVVGPDEISGGRLLQRYLQFADLVAYWMWQFASDLESVFRVAAERVQELRIRLALHPAESWTSNDNLLVMDAQEPRVNSRTTDPDEIEVELHPAILQLLETADNSGERHIMFGVLTALADWSINHGIAIHDAEGWTRDILDRNAPIGPKKKLIIIGGSEAERRRTDGLPPKREVQEAEEGRVLDEIGEYLASDGAHSVGPIPDSERVQVLNAIVSHLFSVLDATLSAHAPDEVLPWLVSFQERLVAEHRMLLLELPTREACYGATQDVVARLRDELPDAAKSLLASRFLIEYATAQPPTGTGVPSMASYDRLLAVASEIANLGWASDLIHYELADIKLARLESGRLGQSRGHFDVGHDQFMTVFARGTLNRSRKYFVRHWLDKPGEATERPAFVNDVDNAVRADLGFGITEQLEFFAEGINAGMRRDSEANVATRDQLVVELVERLGWESARVNDALDLLSLRPRSPFLDPPAPHRPADVFPWRFNRSLSYLRRPFLIRLRDGAQDVVWGVRQLYEAFDYLAELALNGRMKLTGAGLQRIVGEMQAVEAEAFNDDVAVMCESVTTAIVRKRVKKIGHRRIVRDNGEDLGDIDVLVVDPRRKIVWPIETKDLAVARTPAELATELRITFAEGGRKQSHAEKHLARAEWVRSHLGEILQALGIGGVGARPTDWVVRPLIVVSHELMTPYIASSPIRVVPSSDLLGVLSAQHRK